MQNGVSFLLCALNSDNKAATCTMFCMKIAKHILVNMEKHWFFVYIETLKDISFNHDINN